MTAPPPAWAAHALTPDITGSSVEWLPTLPPGVPVIDWQSFLGGQADPYVAPGSVPRPWPGFIWKQDEHVTLIGPTGVGKSTLVRELLPYRKFVWIAAAKPQDETLDKYVREDGFDIVQDPHGRLPQPRKRIRLDNATGRWRQTIDPVRLIVRPKFIDTESLSYEDHQAAIFRPLLRASFALGGWCHVADDLDYMVNDLGLERYYRRLYALGRAGRSVVVSNLQRPRNVPLLAYSSATHLFLYCTNDDDDLKRLEGLGGLPTKLIRSIVASLPEYVVLYVNTRDRKLAVTQVGRKAA